MSLPSQEGCKRERTMAVVGKGLTSGQGDTAIADAVGRTAIAAASLTTATAPRGRRTEGGRSDRSATAVLPTLVDVETAF